MTGVGRVSGVAAIAIAVVSLLTGCAAPGVLQEAGIRRPHDGNAAPTSQSEIPVWRLEELARIDHAAIMLRNRQGIHGAVETGLLRRILAIGERIVAASGGGPKPEFMVLASTTVNAFAYVDATQPTIALSLGMIQLLAGDEDEWAALFGHELAHLRLDHIGGMQDRHQKAEIASSVAGAILSVIGLPLASVAADATLALADRAYSRDDEREADRIGLQYMRQAGFADAGAIRLQQRLQTIRSGASIPFLSTHPGGDERIDYLRQLMQGGN